MLKSTKLSGTPAVFNLGLLFQATQQQPMQTAELMEYLTSKSIRDLRVAPDIDINKGNDFTDFPVDKIHLLFNCINFRHLFDTSDPVTLAQKKTEVYNNLVSHLKLNLLLQYSECVAHDIHAIDSMIVAYMKPLVDRCIKLHLYADEYGTVNEGIRKFWSLVDHYLFTARQKHRLNDLKTFTANTNTTYYD